MMFPPMPVRDQLTLSPLQKWRKYRRLPYKFTVHVLIVCLCSALIILQAAQYAKYSNNTNDTFQKLFFPTAFADGIFTMEDFVQTINQSLHVYETFGTESVDRNVYHGNAAGYPTKRARSTELIVERYEKPFFNRTSLQYMSDNFQDKGTYVEVYNISSHKMGPLSGSKDTYSKFFENVVTIKTRFYFNNINVGIFGAVPFSWLVELQYQFHQGGGQLIYDIVTQKFYINQDASIKTFMWINIAIGVFALWSLFLSGKSLTRNYFIFKRVRTKFENKVRGGIVFGNKSIGVKQDELADHYGTWQEVPVDVKLQFFNLWDVWIIVGNLILISASVLGILFVLNESGELPYQITLGVGTIFACCNMIRYLEFNAKFYTLIMTLKNSFTRIGVFLISVIPIFYGYALAGVVMFSQDSELFIDFGTTTVTLFGLINADDVMKTFTSLSEDFDHTWIAWIYLYTFMLLFILAVLNVFIFIIEDAFHAAKSWGKKARKRRAALRGKSYPEKKKRPKVFDIARLFEVIEDPEITPFLGAIRSGSPSPMQSFANLSSRSNNDIRIEITEPNDEGTGEIERGDYSVPRLGARLHHHSKRKSRSRSRSRSSRSDGMQDGNELINFASDQPSSPSHTQRLSSTQSQEIDALLERHRQKMMQDIQATYELHNRNLLFDLKQLLERDADSQEKEE